MTTASFEGRILFRDGEIEDRTIWIYELTPLDLGRRPLAEWVEEHLDMWDYEEWSEQFGLDEEDAVNFEVIFKGQISGGMQWTPCGDEWDEEIHLYEQEKQALPDDWFDNPYPVMLPLGGDDETI